MTTPAPESEAGGLWGRIRAWLEKDVEPEVKAARAEAAKALGLLQELAPELQTFGTAIVTLAKAADPAAAPEVAAIVTALEAAEAKVSALAAKILGDGM
jgi:hypothetical protein